MLPNAAEIRAWLVNRSRPVRLVKIGVQSSPGDEGDRVLVFAIQGWRRCSNAGINEYDVMVTNQSGDKFAVIGADDGTLETGDANGEFATLVVNIATGESTLMPASAPTDSAVVYVVALASQLGLSQEAPRFTYFTETFNAGGEGEPDPTSEVASFNAYSSALLVQADLVSLAPDATTTIPVQTDASEWALTPPKGLMTVFAENAPGAEQAALLGITDLVPAPAAPPQVSSQP
jgi:hypothetical protein